MSINGVSIGGKKMEVEFVYELEKLLNRYSQENGSDTPDFILAQYLKGCLDNYNSCVNARDTYYEG